MRHLHVAAWLALAVLTASCGRQEKLQQPHVLLLTVDTLRPDYMGLYGYDLPTTPFLDSLLDEACVFERAITPVPRTTQALASLLTGTYPHRNGVRTLFDPLSDEVTSIAEVAKAAGYHTVAVVSNHILPPKRRLNRGFDVYDFAGDAREAAATTSAALTRLKQLPDTERVFLWVHYIDPHVPYYPPEELARQFDPGYEGRYALNFGDRKGGTGDNAYPADLPKVQAVFQNALPPPVNAHIRRLYAADIRQTDDAIRDLMTGLRQINEDWLTVFTADHGESLGEHKYFYDHGDYVYDATVRVPLAILLPEGDPSRQARRHASPVSLVDVAPTLLELTGLPGDDFASQFEGRSLVPILRGESLPAVPAFAECGQSFFPQQVRRRVQFDVAGRFRAVVDGEWKLIWTPGAEEEDAFELYDFVRDPREKKNLYQPNHPAVPRLIQLLGEWVRPDDAARQGPSDDDLERLRSLGYVE